MINLSSINVFLVHKALLLFKFNAVDKYAGFRVPFSLFSLLFLIHMSNLQVYVIRANDLNEVDGALSLLNLETLTKQSDAG